MITVLVVLAIAAFLCAVFAAVRPASLPLWVAVLLLSIYALLQTLPVDRR